MRVAILMVLMTAPGFATTWSGFLVDSRCWNSRQTNVTAETTTVGRSMNAEVRDCSPTDDTKRFSVVQRDWRRFRLDSDGNVRAAQIVRKNQKRRVVYDVNVNGVLGERRTIKVSSISARAIRPPATRF